MYRLDIRQPKGRYIEGNIEYGNVHVHDTTDRIDSGSASADTLFY